MIAITTNNSIKVNPRAKGEVAENDFVKDLVFMGSHQTNGRHWLPVPLGNQAR